MEIPIKGKRRFLPEDVVLDSWNALKPFFEELKSHKLNSKGELKEWMKDLSEVISVLQEEKAWRYIRMNINTRNKKLETLFNKFIREITPKTAPYWNEFNKKLANCKFSKELTEKSYEILLRGIKKEIEIYREENIPLITKLEEESQEYRSIAGKMTIEHEGKELTMPEAEKLLKEQDEALRKEIYEKIYKRRKKDEVKLNELYTNLIKKRNLVAKNAGFKNYRDYKFADLGRFDYNPKDCFEFHEAIEKEVMPLKNSLDKKRKEKLRVEKLKPWDMVVDLSEKEPLKPFETGEELIEKSIKCFSKIKPYFGERLQILKNIKYLSLESKLGKAPGGFNYPLHEIGVPFIFMNSVGSQKDLQTIMHEGGHAIHSFLTRDLELIGFKDIPLEVAELASMTMELLTTDYWDEFYNEEDLKRAKTELLEGIVNTLPWIASVDKFQHWIYENPEHTLKERKNTWKSIMKKFGSSVIDWNNWEDSKYISWQRQLHIFKVPFYFIEYGIAQLGALAIWKNYKENGKEKTIQQYTNALKLGYTKDIKEIYETAGIKFDFSKEHIRELMSFVKNELKKLK